MSQPAAVTPWPGTRSSRHPARDFAHIHFPLYTIQCIRRWRDEGYIDLDRFSRLLDCAAEVHPAQARCPDL